MTCLALTYDLNRRLQRKENKMRAQLTNSFEFPLELKGKLNDEQLSVLSLPFMIKREIKRDFDYYAKMCRIFKAQFCKACNCYSGKELRRFVL